MLRNENTTIKLLLNTQQPRHHSESQEAALLPLAGSRLVKQPVQTHIFSGSNSLKRQQAALAVARGTEKLRRIMAAMTTDAPQIHKIFHCCETATVGCCLCNATGKRGTVCHRI
jgi:hypothetical protein